MDAGTTHRVFVGGRVMRLYRHAVERYVERVKPHLSYADGAVELERLLQGCEVTSEKPAWANRRENQTGWIVVVDAIAFPVVGEAIVTCMTRTSVGAELRIVRGSERRDRRERNGRPGTRKKHGKVARDERRRVRAMRDAADG